MPSRSTCGWIVGLIVLGAFQASISARAQSAAGSAYTVATMSVTIVYNTGPDPTGAIKLNANTAWPAPQTVDIRCDAANGLCPDTVAVVCDVTYSGKTGRYPGDPGMNAIKLKNGRYTIDLTAGFTQWLLAAINNMLPPHFDPSAAPSFSTSVDVTVTVTPAAVAGFQSSATKATGTLKITLQHVLGDPKQAAALLKVQAPATGSSPHHQVAPQLATLCPRCGPAGAELVCCPVSPPWLMARGAVAVMPCPIPSYPPMTAYYYSTLSYSPSAGRTCWP